MMELSVCIDEREPTDLTVSDYHRMLANERRRRALVVLCDQPMPVDLRTLAEEMLERSEGHGDDAGADVHELMVELYHRHLPMLDEVGAVELDETGKRVEVCRIEVTGR